MMHVTAFGYTLAHATHKTPYVSHAVQFKLYNLISVLILTQRINIHSLMYIAQFQL